MILTNKQQMGLKIAVERYKHNEPYTIISGYAGAGKSTLIKFIIAALGVDPDAQVCYVAYTGKAAQVLASKGCPNATTAHKLLYWAKLTAKGTYTFTPKPTSELEDYKVIVVDEVSMLPLEMWNLLLSHHIYVLACGDPGQLPPINPKDDNHILDNPHVFLDEIMRQALDSEIIRLSMHIREGKPLITYKPTGEQVQIYNKWDVYPAMLMWADQVLCASNENRIDLNNQIRAEKGYPADTPVTGDKLIGLHNYWETFSTSGDWALTNGMIGTLTNFEIKKEYFPRYLHPGPVWYMYADMEIENGTDSFINIPIDYNRLLTGKPTLTNIEIYNIKKKKDLDLEPPYAFSYAYAITTWKAQGSEYDKVLLFEENHPWDKELHKKYLYTGITRAKEKIVIIKK